MEKLSELFKGKRKNENLITLLVLMIVVVVAINYIWKEKPADKKEEQNTELSSNMVKQVSAEIKSDDLEQKLENILSKISGAGKVNVMITYSESSTTEPIYDENYKETNTVENDDSGGTRNISETDNQKQIVFKQNSDGSKEPVTKSVLSPKIEGAIITAQGAKNSAVKTNIIQAVEAATGLATHKIQVFEMEEN